MRDFNRIARGVDAVTPPSDVELGHLVELFQTGEGVNTISVTSPFTYGHMLQDWPMATFMYTGNTLKSNDEIESEGNRSFHDSSESQAVSISKERPKYNLINNNCQNFAKYLIEAISLAHLDTQTLEDIVAGLFDTASSSTVRLPETYPESSNIDTCQELMTPRSTFTSYHTAEQTPFYTASSRFKSWKPFGLDNTSIITVEPNVEDTYIEMQWTLW